MFGSSQNHLFWCRSGVSVEERRKEVSDELLLLFFRSFPIMRREDSTEAPPDLAAPLLQAIDRGDLIRIYEILDDPAYDADCSSCSGIEEDSPGLDHDDAPMLPGDPPCAAHDTPLMRAARRGLIGALIRLLRHATHSAVASKNGIGLTALMVACGSNQRTAASMLLRAAPNAVDVADNEGVTALSAACQAGYSAVVEVLLEAGAAVDHQDHLGFTPLLAACQEGHAEIVKQLLAAGAPLHSPTGPDGLDPLHAACQEGHPDVVSLLLHSRADVDRPMRDRCASTALRLACRFGHLRCVQLLSSHGACRTWSSSEHDGTSMTAERVATLRGHAPTLGAWLAASRQWPTALHHLDVIDTQRVRQLLREGASLNAASQGGGPTPLTLARSLHLSGRAPYGSAAHLVLCAAEPWSPTNHQLYPATQRRQAEALHRVGLLLARQRRFAGGGSALMDVWVGHVMPFAVVRQPL